MNLGFMLHVGFVRLIEFKDLRAYVVKFHCDLNIFDHCYFISRDAFVRYPGQLLKLLKFSCESIFCSLRDSMGWLSSMVAVAAGNVRVMILTEKTLKGLK